MKAALSNKDLQDEDPAQKIVLFDTLTIPTGWDNAQMAKINGMTIKVEAYATQTNGFANCFKAMYTAFPTAFPFAPTNP